MFEEMSIRRAEEEWQRELWSSGRAVCRQLANCEEHPLKYLILFLISTQGGAGVRKRRSQESNFHVVDII
jgi:hypothetical protein